MSRDSDPAAKVYIGDLGESGSKPELEKEFEKFGPLKSVWVARNPPGFAFVQFEDRRDAEDSVKEMDGKRVCGVHIRVEIAKSRNGPPRGDRFRDRDDRGGDRGGGRDYQRYRPDGGDRRGDWRDKGDRYRDRSPRRGGYKRSTSPYGHGEISPR